MRYWKFPPHQLLAPLIVLLIMLILGCTIEQRAQEVVSYPWKTYAAHRQRQSINETSPILQIDILFQRLNPKPLTIRKIKLLTGYSPTLQTKGEYFIELEDKDKKRLLKIPFTVPNDLADVPPQDEEDDGSARLILDHVTFSVTLPRVTGTTTVLVKDTQGLLLSQHSLGGLTMIRNVPAFDSFLGSEAQIAPSSSPTGPLLDLTFISSQYSDMSLFRTDVDQFSNFLFSIEPFKSRMPQFRINRVENNTDLGCQYFDRSIVCDNTRVTTQVNLSGSPHDKIVVIHNNSVYGGSGGPIAVSYNGFKGKEVFVHEFGHALGNLHDEYTLTYQNLRDGTVQKNCFAGTPPAFEWQSLVALGDYRQGCLDAFYYRSSPSSMMLDLTPYFNAVSQALLNLEIDSFTSPFVDSIPPSAGIVSPVDGGKISAGNQIITSISDNIGVVRAELWVNGILSHTEYEQPFSFFWDGSRNPAGSYEILVKGYDVAGNSSSSQSILVTSGQGGGGSTTPIRCSPKVNSNFQSEAGGCRQRGELFGVGISDGTSGLRLRNRVSHSKVKAFRVGVFPL